MPVLILMINSDTRQFIRPGAWRVAWPMQKQNYKPQLVVCREKNHHLIRAHWSLRLCSPY